MTEKEIIKMWKKNDRHWSSSNITEEMRSWAKERFWQFYRIDQNGKLCPTVDNIYSAGSVYVLRPDYPESSPLPELEEGLYFLVKKNGIKWMFGEYCGISDVRYEFRQAKESHSFTIDPAKWDIRRIVTEVVK